MISFLENKWDEGWSVCKRGRPLVAGFCNHPALSFSHTILPDMQKVKLPAPGGVVP
jgi:hypothetical protein